MSSYLDASAIVKLVVRERESGALLDHVMTAGRQLVTSSLSRIEVVRAVAGAEDRITSLARRVFEQIDLLPIGAAVIEGAMTISPRRRIRILDAIHLASATVLGDLLDEVVTYDLRMAEAARDLGLEVVAPG